MGDSNQPLNTAPISPSLPQTVIVPSQEGGHFLVEAPASFQARMQHALQKTALLGNFHLPPLPGPASFSLAAYQTLPIRNQQDRGTCWAFGGVAALEAAYKRKYHLDLDLSEQYVFHMGKATELYSDYATSTTPHENNCSLWGFQGSSDIIHHLSRFAVPEERFCPYLDQSHLEAIHHDIAASGTLDWESTQEQLDAFEFAEQLIPTAARWNAAYQVASYSAIPQPVTTDGLEQIIAGGHEIVVDINVKWRFDTTTNAYDYDPASGGGGHVLLLIGYDRDQQVFLAKNSWGESSFIRLTYNFVRNCVSQGYYITDVTDPERGAQKQAFWLGFWNIDHDGWRGRLTFRRFTDMHSSDPNAPTKLGNYYRDDQRHDVNGYFVQDGQGIVFWIADTSGRIPPGSLTGQRFDTFYFSFDPEDGGGKTIWNDTNFGAILSREKIPEGVRVSPFEKELWVGNWSMNHDGWQGTLALTSFRPFPLPFLPGLYLLDATYQNREGVVFPVTGTLSDGTPHLMTINIKFAEDNQQRFDLMHHTWEGNIFSGVTYWGGQSFGVQAYKTE